MNVSKMLPSKWMKATDEELESDFTVTVAELRSEPVSDDESKWVLYFEETDKGLVLNKINTVSIAKLLGDETDDWIGQRVTLFATETDFAGKRVPCIRVRSKAFRPPVRSGKPAAPVAQREADDVPF